ncbi:sensor histidine kinase [Nocardia jejuensis]|uniref:sensor histidine kinase n=1 Tax=Nocardia jejuensis TaxID=328049 RepID=UPI00082A5D65|nr:HAMP domain-containing sensor histidine kinase [Nocardia jejuensis]
MAVGRPISLRTRVALASAVTAAVVVGGMSAVLFAVAPTDARTQVGTVVSALAIQRAEPLSTEPPADGPADARTPQRVITVNPGTPFPGTDSDASALPPLPAEFARTVPVDGQTVMLTVPQNVASDSVAKQRVRIIAVGLAGIALAALLGWYFASRAVAPLRRLTAATAGLGTRPDAPDHLALATSNRSVASETAELTEAMNTMLGRISAERRHTDEALVTARDFAATAAHELRTPLTAMRTDLQVLQSMPLSEAERAEIIGEVLASQHTVESTLAALERLAVGDLTTESDWEEVDLGQLVDQVVEDARRAHPAVTIDTDGVDPIRLRGLAAGLRSVIDNAVTNAVRHGAATRIDIAAHHVPRSSPATDDSGDQPGRADARGRAHSSGPEAPAVPHSPDSGAVILTIDDNGTGIPAADRERVFDRFHRAATTPGLGLGLALVAQQARLHGGDATIENSPLGGVRLIVTLVPDRAHASGQFRPAAPSAPAASS